MARRFNSSQFRSAMNRLQNDLRRQQQKVKQEVRRVETAYKKAVNEYNRQVRSYNQSVRQAVNKHNQQVRAHNAQVSRNRQSLRRSLNALKARPAIQTYVTVRESTYFLHERYERLEDQWATGDATPPDIAALVQRESGNSVDVLNALLSTGEEAVEDVVDEDNGVDAFLSDFSPDLHQRWQGAIFALNPRNPDAARHFCTSVREIFREVLDGTAPDIDVRGENPDCELTPQGTPSRRAKIFYLLRLKGIQSNSLSEFIDADITNIIDLFGVFNKGTHGPAGTHAYTALKAIKRRVQDGIMFLASIAV